MEGVKKALIDHRRGREYSSFHFISHNSCAMGCSFPEKMVVYWNKCLSQCILFPKKSRQLSKQDLLSTPTFTSSRVLSDPGLFVQKTRETNITLEKFCTPLYFQWFFFIVQSHAHVHVHVHVHCTLHVHWPSLNTVLIF